MSPTSPTIKPGVSTSPNELGISKTQLKVSFRDRIKNLQQQPDTKPEKFLNVETSDIKQLLIPSTSVQKPKKVSTTRQIKDKIKSLSHHRDEPLTPWSKLKLATVVSLGGSYTSLNNSINEDSPKLSKTIKNKTSMPVNLNAVNSIEFSLQLHPTANQHITSVSDSELKSDSAPLTTAKCKRKPRPFTLIREPKCYSSVDDLSPEYSGLPFVKKLKILNERQKLAELESVIQTRSFSLDCTDSSNSNEMVEVLTRSHSEASCIVSRPKALTSTFSPKAPPVAPFNFSTQISLNSPISPESNETLERKKLKSILKKLSEEQNSISKPTENTRQEMKRLMRAQTVEGYVARRSKFIKSVTFNNTLSSPPNSANILAEEPDETTTIPSPFLPSNLSTTPNHTQALYPITKDAQDTTALPHNNSTKLQTTMRNNNYKSELDHSTNRFNYPTVSSPEQEIINNELPSTQTYIEETSRFSFISDEFSQTKTLIKGI